MSPSRSGDWRYPPRVIVVFCSPCIAETCVSSIALMKSASLTCMRGVSWKSSPLSSSSSSSWRCLNSSISCCDIVDILLPFLRFIEGLFFSSSFFLFSRFSTAKASAWPGATPSCCGKNAGALVLPVAALAACWATSITFSASATTRSFPAAGAAAVACVGVCGAFTAAAAVPLPFSIMDFSTPGAPFKPWTVLLVLWSRLFWSCASRDRCCLVWHTPQKVLISVPEARAWAACSQLGGQ
mmetsp:Transcript_12639/g.32743  ORF Transcript_12639/g.32743 Transcript_12639/m.32743 type:complete len:240 (+) Transcript_12639:626-1345(+)